MPRPTSEQLRRTLFTLAAAVVTGGLAGAVVSWTISPVSVQITIAQQSSSNGATNTVATTTSPVTVIPVDRIPQPSLLPPAFVERSISSVGGIYRREKGVGDGLLSEDQLVSQAVAVTADGWFVAPAAAMNGLQLADILVWHDNISSTPTRAVLDRLSGVVFIKTTLTHLSAPAFARPSDVTTGLGVWLERRAQRFESLGVVALFETLSSLDGVSSEVAVRRGVVSGVANTGDRGSPLWSSNGALIGMQSAAAGESLRFIPASSWSASLSSLLENGTIRHAVLGVRTVNISWAHADGSSRIPQGRGAWLHDDVKGKKPAVDRSSPAATAGLRAGDVIREVDRDIMDESVDLGELLAGYRPGSKVTLTVNRAGSMMEIPVELGSVVTSEELK